MSKTLKKSIRNGLIGLVLLGTFSFIYGGIYTEIIQEGLEITTSNILLALVGAYLISGLIFAFFPVFIVSLIIYYFKHKESK